MSISVSLLVLWLLLACATGERTGRGVGARWSPAAKLAPHFFGESFQGTFPQSPQQSLFLEGEVAGCQEEAEVFFYPGDTKLHFRIKATTISMFTSYDTFELKSEPDCGGQTLPTNVSVIGVANRTHMMESSWAEVFVDKDFPAKTGYLCLQSDATSKGRIWEDRMVRCIAAVRWPQNAFSPFTVLAAIPGVWPQSVRDFFVEVDAMDDPLLDFLSWTMTVLGVLFLVATLHAIFLALTSPPPSDKQLELRGLISNPVYETLMTGIIQLFSFTVGLCSSLGLAIQIIFAWVNPSLIQAILVSGLAFGLLALTRLIQLLNGTLIFEVSLRYGKCVLPSKGSRLIAIPDLIILLAFLLTFGLLFFSFLSAQLDPAEFTGCISGFLAVAAGLNNIFALQRQQAQGLCRVSMPILAENLNFVEPESGPSATRTTERAEADRGAAAEGSAVAEVDNSREESEEGEKVVDMVEHLKHHPKVSLTIGQFCASARAGHEDPFEEMEKSKEAMAEGYSLLPIDVRWFGKFVLRKTGSKAGFASLPLGLIIALLMLGQLFQMTLRCKSLQPFLTSLSPSTGVLIPDFSPHLKEYTFVHQPGINNMNIWTSAEPKVAQKKELLMGEWKKSLPASVPMANIDLQGFKKHFPYDLSIKVQGFETDGVASRSQQYHVNFAELLRVPMTVVLTSGSWSKCFYWGPLYKRAFGLPPGKDTFSMEVMYTEYASRIPMSEHQYRNDVPKAFSGVLTVFVPLANADDTRCRDLCDRHLHCKSTRVGTEGCLHLMVQEAKGQCEETHRRAKSRLRDNALGNFVRSTEVKGRLCRVSKYRGYDCSHVSKSAQNSAYLNLENMSIKASRRADFYNFAIGLREADAYETRWLEDYRLEVWKGPPRPATFMAVSTKGTAVILVPAQAGYDIRFRKYKVKNLPPMIQLLFIILVEDIEVTLPPNLKPWDGNRTGLDFSACETNAEVYKVLWACNQEGPEPPPDQVAFVLQLDPFMPQESWTFLEVSHVDAGHAHFDINIDTKQTPIRWALKEDCTIDVKEKGPDYLLRLLDDAVFIHGIELCPAVTLMYQGRQCAVDQVKVTMKMPEWVSFGFRLYPLEAQRKKILQAVFEHGRTEVQFLPHPRGVRLELENEPRHSDADLCMRHLPPQRETMLLPWKDTLEALSDSLVDSLCDSKTGKFGLVGSHVASALRDGDAPNETLLARLMDCAEIQRSKLNDMNTDGEDWYFQRTSPLFAAMKGHTTHFLNALLEKVPAASIDEIQVFSRDVNRMTWRTPAELAVVFGCPECLLEMPMRGVRLPREFFGGNLIGAWKKEDVKATLRQCRRVPVGLTEDHPKAACNTFQTLDLGNFGLGDTSREVFDRGVSCLRALGASEVPFDVLDVTADGLGNGRSRYLLSGIADWKHLKELILDDNGIGSCHTPSVEAFSFLPELPKSLERLSLDGNDLCSDSSLKVLASAITDNVTALQSLSLESCRISQTEKVGLVALGAAASQLTALSLSNNFVGPVLGDMFTAMNMNGLLKLTLKQVGLTEADCQRRHHSDQKRNNNQKNEKEKEKEKETEAEAEEVGPSLVEALQKAVSLVSLDLSQNGLQDGGLLALAPALKAMKNLRSLNLGGIGLTGTGLAAFVNRLQGQSWALKELNLADLILVQSPQLATNEAADAAKEAKESAAASSRSSPSSPSPSPSSPSSPSSSSSLAATSSSKSPQHRLFQTLEVLLGNAESLRVLDLSNTALGDEGGQALVDIINRREEGTPWLRGLRILKLAGNGFSLEMLEKVLGSLKQLPELRVLDLSNSRTSSRPKLRGKGGGKKKDVALLDVPLNRILNLKTLDLSGNPVRCAAFNARAPKMSLEKLYLRRSLGKKVTGETCNLEAFSRWLQKQANLQVLDISENIFQSVNKWPRGGAGGGAAGKLAKLPQLKELHVGKTGLRPTDFAKMAEQTGSPSSAFSKLELAMGTWTPSDALALRSIFRHAAVISTAKLKD